VTLRLAVVYFIYAVFFRELWVAVRSFTRLGFSMNAALLGVSYWIMLFQIQVAGLYPLGVIPGAVLLIAALVLLEWAGRSIRGRFFSYLGNTDTPKFVFQQGPYAYIRHPFYTSYWVSHVAVALMFPNRVTAITALGTFVLLWLTAAFEERKFASSPLGADYQEYTSRTGRFLPRLRR
jgi:protein-S-isoprenylcysteine O-methyltransferase Ste14